MSGSGSLLSRRGGNAGISPVELLLGLAISATLLTVIVPGVLHLRAAIAVRSRRRDRSDGVLPGPFGRHIPAACSSE